MNQALEQFIDPAYRYVFTQGPDVVHTKNDARTRGINCISLAHLALKDLFGYQLPPGLKCFELYSDSQHFSRVVDIHHMELGDLVWFGLDHPNISSDEFRPDYQNGELVNWADFPIKHVAIYTGEVDEDYLLLHSTHIEGTNTVWPLKAFAEYSRYQKLYNITRLTQEVQTT